MRLREEQEIDYREEGQDEETEMMKQGYFWSMQVVDLPNVP